MDDMTLKVVVITQEEPFFIPKMIDRLLKENQGEKGFEVIGATILKPHRKNKNMMHWVRERAKIYTLFELGVVGAAFFGTKFRKGLNRNKNIHSVRRKFESEDIPIFETSDINSNTFVEQIKHLNTDVIVSISCPQIFSANLLNAVNKVCINAHGTLLPRHRGVFGTWWTLFSGDSEAGSTIHTMEEKLDSGDIVWRKSFQIQKDDTQYSLAYKTKRDMTNGLIEVLSDIKNNSLKPIDPVHDTSYNRAPSKELGKEFHKKGFRVLRVKDLKYIFTKSYE